MKLRERLNEQLKKVQALPEKTRKIIFWSMIIAISSGLLFFWTDHLVKMIRNFSLEGAAEDLNFQDLSSKAGQAMKLEGEMKEKIEQLAK